MGGGAAGTSRTPCQPRGSKPRTVAMVQIRCANCHRRFVRLKAEYQRSQALRRRSFCCQSCASRFNNRMFPHGGKPGDALGPARDQFSPFRRILASVRRRSKVCHRKPSLSLKYLRQLWLSQRGACPLTGWKMTMPPSTSARSARSEWPRQASLDRIDPRRWYVRGNVRFVCLIANLARHTFSDEELVKFCKAVALHRRAKHGRKRSA